MNGYIEFEDSTDYERSSFGKVSVFASDIVGVQEVMLTKYSVGLMKSNKENIGWAVRILLRGGHEVYVLVPYQDVLHKIANSIA